MEVKQGHVGLVMLFIPIGLVYSRRPLSSCRPRDTHHLMWMPSGIEVMSSVYGVVNFILLHMHMKLMGIMESLASLYVTSLLLPKNTIVSCLYSMAPSVLADGSWNVAFLLLFIHWKKVFINGSLSSFY